MLLRTFLENLGYETRSYSGRGMYGKECLAIVVDDALDAIQQIAYEIGEYNNEESYQDHQVKFPVRVLSENMGRQTVVYWPGVKYEEEETNNVTSNA